jgi:hypothetical protein
LRAALKDTHAESQHLIRFPATMCSIFSMAQHRTTLDLIHRETPCPGARTLRNHFMPQGLATSGLVHSWRTDAGLRNSMPSAAHASGPVNTLCWRGICRNVSACEIEPLHDSSSMIDAILTKCSKFKDNANTSANQDEKINPEQPLEDRPQQCPQAMEGDRGSLPPACHHHNLAPHAIDDGLFVVEISEYFHKVTR